MANYLDQEPHRQRCSSSATPSNVGGLDYNLALSQKRAQAVVAALTGKYRIAPARLVARGVGPLSPIASNREDAGRAKNRQGGDGGDGKLEQFLYFGFWGLELHFNSPSWANQARP